MKYGVVFDGTNSAGTRTYGASGLTWQRSTNTVAGTDDFASLAPFNVKECITQYNSGTGEREVLAYKGDSSWSSLISQGTGDRMVEFPIFWYKRPSKYEWIISDVKEAGFKPSPMHYRNGKYYGTIRVSKYAVDSTYSSQTGTAPLVNTNMNTFRTNLRAKGMYMIDYPTWCSLVTLMLIKYNNMDVQSTVGFGVSNSSATVNSGNADGVLGLDGSPTTISTSESVLTFGIENFFSNVWKFIDGFYGYNGNLYIKDIESIVNDPVDYNELMSSYTKVNMNIVSSAVNDPISDISYSSDFDWMLFPTSTGSPNPTGDACYVTANFNCLVLGGARTHSSNAGLFFLHLTDAVSSSAFNRSSLAIEFGEELPQNPKKFIYLTTDNKAYGIDSTEALIKLSDDWTMLTDSEKKTLFDSTLESTQASASDLRALGNFKVLVYEDDNKSLNCRIVNDAYYFTIDFSSLSSNVETAITSLTDTDNSIIELNGNYYEFIDSANVMRNKKIASSLVIDLNDVRTRVSGGESVTSAFANVMQSVMGGEVITSGGTITLKIDSNTDKMNCYITQEE